MRCKILHILMTVALVSISTSGRAEPTPESFAAGDRKKSKDDFKVDQAYAERRVIGLLSPVTAACPTVDGWTFRTLEDQVVLGIQETLKTTTRVNPGYYGASSVQLSEPNIDIDRKPLRKLNLDRYCIYTKISDLSFRPPKEAFVKAERDRLALSITSAGAVPLDDIGQRIWPALEKNFRSETGQVAPDETSAVGLTGSPGVRLTFIDSQPDGEWPPVLPDGSQHGFTLVHMAHSLVCPTSGSCAASIKTRRALSYSNFIPGQPFPPVEAPLPGQSGHVGLTSDLAAAIYAEVLYWKQFDPNKKLILNLSLGWDGEAFGDLEKRQTSKLEPSVRAVYNALRFARRSGALVIAAAGNQRGGGGTKWPLLPAAWELRRPNWFRWAFFHKSVYAVGGVDWQGLPIPNSRRGGQPRRAAYADHSVIGTIFPYDAEEADVPTAMYTGTSVSAAVASSIAAVVWHLRPELQPAQVMKLITLAGDELPSLADFYAWKPLSKRGPHTRRLSLCTAVEKACGQDGGRCRDLAFSPKCLPWNGTRQPRIQESLYDLTGIPATLEPAIPPDDPVDMASLRWVVPQPEATPCPGCAVVRRPPPFRESAFEYTLRVQVGTDWKKEAEEDDLEIVGGTFVVRCTAGEFSRKLDPPSLGDLSDLESPGPVYEIPFDFGQSLSGCTAQINYIVEDTTPGTEAEPEPEPMSVKNPVAFSPES